MLQLQRQIQQDRLVDGSSHIRLWFIHNIHVRSSQNNKALYQHCAFVGTNGNGDTANSITVVGFLLSIMCVCVCVSACACVSYPIRSHPLWPTSSGNMMLSLVPNGFVWHVLVSVLPSVVPPGSKGNVALHRPCHIWSIAGAPCLGWDGEGVTHMHSSAGAQRAEKNPLWQEKAESWFGGFND